MLLFSVVLSFVLLQRIFELLLSKHNEHWLRVRGAYEVGKGHYPLIISLHVAFYISLPVEVSYFNLRPAPWSWIPFMAFLAAQSLRYWSVLTLGRRWCTRVLVIPGETPVATGPYRFLRHPNYVAVAIELSAIPLIFQAYITATIFSLLNGAIMAVRIPLETRALRGSKPQRSQFS